MPTVTVPLGLTKPTVGGDKDVWGQYWNDNADKLNAIHTDDGTGTAVGMHVGTDQVLSVDGTFQIKDITDETHTSVVTFIAADADANVTVELKSPTVGGTIATEEAMTAVVAITHPTGTILSGYYGTAPTGYVFADGRTIGDATSSATNRANDDCERLFKHLWTMGFALVGGTRLATAQLDWDAHKQLILPNHSGRVMAGRDNLSGTAAGVLPGYTFGVAGGAYSHALTIGETPYHNHLGADHLHSGTANLAFMYAAGGGAWGQTVEGGTHVVGYNALTGAADRELWTSYTGGGFAHNNVQPTIAVDVIIAL